VPYDEDKWFEEAVNEKVRGLRDRSDLTLTLWDPLTDTYTWKNRETYKANPLVQIPAGRKTTPGRNLGNPERNKPERPGTPRNVKRGV